MKSKAAFFSHNGNGCPDLNRVFSPQLRAILEDKTEMLPQVVTPGNFESLSYFLSEVELIFATWGMWGLSPSQINILTNLKAVFYAAGSVKHFALPLLERGISVSSAWTVNAIPVAEFALGQILLSNKGYFRNVHAYREAEAYNTLFRGMGNYGATVSILGAGQVGHKLIELLRPFALRVLVFDPFLSYKGAETLGVEKVETLEEAFQRGHIVSNHLAAVPSTYGLLRGEHFALLPPNATFINTGRGQTVNHEHLLSFLQDRPDVTALLDVTEPEPLPLGHPLRALPNLYLSGHIAGSIGDEVQRMGMLAIEEFERWQAGVPLCCSITPQMLETMA